MFNSRRRRRLVVGNLYRQTTADGRAAVKFPVAIDFDARVSIQFHFDM